MAAIRVELELEDGNFTTRMLHAGQTVQQFNHAAGQSSPTLRAMAQAGQSVVRSISLADDKTRGFLGTLRDIAIVAGIVSVGFGKLQNISSTWIGDIVRINSEFERLNYQMRSMSTAADPLKEAGDAVRFLRAQALDMPFALSTINNGFVKLKATGTDPLNGSLRSLADGVAAFGGTDESFNRVVLGISQMSGKGVIQMEELRQQLGESMPTAVAIMARSMGVSMSQLIQDIGTGTLGAKQALALFYNELERSYGGRARYMMQTFEGQLKRTQTQLQNLALEAGGIGADGVYRKGGFMDELRNQLRDLNSILGSRVGSQLAQDLGSGLASAVRWMRTGIETLVDFRQELTRFAIVAASVFAFKMGISGIATFTSALSNLRTNLRAVEISMRSLQTQQSLLNIMTNSGAPLMTVLGQRVAMLRTGIASLAMGAAVLAPWLTAIGLGAYAAAEYFGVFTNEVDEAYDSLVRYGAETRRQAQLVSDQYIAKIEQQIEAEKALRMERMEGLTTDENGQLIPDASIGNLYLLNEKLKKALADRERLIGDAAKREDDKVINAYREATEDKIREVRNRYNREQIETQDSFDKLKEETAKQGKSTEELEAKRGSALLGHAINFHREEERILRESIAEQNRILLDGGQTDIRKAQAKGILEFLQDQLTRAIELRKQVENQTVGTTLIPKSVNDDKEYAKGQQALERINAQVTGLKGELTGANAEVLELQQLLKGGKYGDADTKQVQDLIGALLSAQAEKEKLDELLTGKKKLEGDIERARIDVLEKEMELKEKAAGRELTTAEKIKMRIQEGYYAGFGPQSETVRWLNTMISTFDVQGQTANRVGEILRNNTFGSQTQTRIRSVTDELREMTNVLAGAGSSFAGINFAGPGMSRIRMSGDKFLGGSMLDLIGHAEGTDKGRGYNETLSYGAFSGGPRDLIRMTLDEIDAMQSQMLAHPDNKFNSSAAGRYQIVQQTLRGLRKELGLSGNELFDQSMQDTLATQLLKRRGNNPAGLRNEWEGLRRVDDATISRTFSGAGGAPMPTYGDGEGQAALQATLNQLQADYIRQLDEIEKKERKVQGDEKALARADALKDLKGKAKEAATDVDGLNKNYAELVKQIEAGKLGDNKDIGAAEYKDLITAAKELDRVEAETAEKKKARTKIDNASADFKQREIELARRMEEANARITDPLERKSSSAFRALRQEMQEYLGDVEKFYGKDSDEYRAAQNLKLNELRRFRNVEVAEQAAAWAKQSQDIRVSLMSESQQRQWALKQQIDAIDKAVADFRGSEDEKVEIVRAAEEAKARIRQQYADQMTPFNRQMREWGDFQGNLARQSVQWMDSMAGGLADLIMGTGDLKQVLNSMLRDLIQMGLKSTFAGVAGKGGGAAKGGAGKMGGGGLKKGAFPGVPGVGLYHTGGIIGRPSRMRGADPKIFRFAGKMHTGGVIGAPRLASDEVPIIARKGEGVFTPEQMASMGGFSQNSVNINAPITVNGGGGSPAQNADLAKQVSSQVVGGMRELVTSEIQKQMRPGNMLNQRSTG